jgi:histidinol-phosphate phosphatase family protein
MNVAIFLDRDGVIIENRANYVRSWADVEFIPGALSALAKLKDSSYKIVIITNQAGIGHGIISRAAVEEINERLKHVIQSMNGRIEKIYLCPHKPADGCNCRKPKPGMILDAAQDFNIDLKHSILIGDNLSDIQAGYAAGVGQAVLVRTGLGVESAPKLQTAGLTDVQIYNDLAQALADLVKIP